MATRYPDKLPDDGCACRIGAVVLTWIGCHRRNGEYIIRAIMRWHPGDTIPKSGYNVVALQAGTPREYWVAMKWTRNGKCLMGHGPRVAPPTAPPPYCYRKQVVLEGL